MWVFGLVGAVLLAGGFLLGLRRAEDQTWSMGYWTDFNGYRFFMALGAIILIIYWIFTGHPW